MPKSAFYNSLTKEELSDGDYRKVHDVWNLFEMKTLCDLHDHYMKLDVVLLAEQLPLSRPMVWILFIITVLLD